MRVSWDFIDDPLLRDYVKNISSHSKIVIPSNLFRDENYYQVRLNVSNYDQTYSRTKLINFVPINC
jgi:hypothetical protein